MLAKKGIIKDQIRERISAIYAGACKSPPLSLMHNVLTELAVELCAVLEQSAMNLNKIELF